eukprot:6467585-Amphidinium_carterae.2
MAARPALMGPRGNASTHLFTRLLRDCALATVSCNIEAAPRELLHTLWSRTARALVSPNVVPRIARALVNLAITLVRVKHVIAAVLRHGKR